MSPRKHTQIITKTAATFSFCKEKYNCLVEVLYSQLTEWVNLMGVLRVWVGQLMVTHEPEEVCSMAITSGSDKLLLCYQTFNKVNQKGTSFTSGNSSNQPQVRRHKKHSDIFFRVLSKGQTRYSFRKTEALLDSFMFTEPGALLWLHGASGSPSTRCGPSKSTQAATQATETAPKSYRLRGKQGIEASPFLTQGTTHLVSFLPPSPKEL